MADKFIRKPVVFNRESAWHMEIHNKILKESNNFSGYVMAILKGHFDVKEDITKPVLITTKNEQPKTGARIVINGKKIGLK